ncbi:MAG TPA: serine/threonine-protein kinase, partial [Ktedonobacteraceae bacterium]|nr:serine/threonine-protein kinase [Ktedonobacteraceae bacterium]
MALVSLYCAVCGMQNSPQSRLCSRCAAPLPVSLSPPAGQGGTMAQPVSMVPDTMLKQRYVILERLGRGGMGAVYKAADTELGSAFRAVKEMRRLYLHPQESPEEATEAFKREALMLADLRHQSLPRIYDHFHEQGHWYLVMDYIEGANLEDYLKAKGGRLSIAEVLEIGLQLCNVLEYLHTRQPAIIFRDLKPSNIMRTRDGHIYLIDFGIARIFKKGQAKDTSVFVSYGYAAPEQYSGLQTTPQADIYSLGATL